MVVLVLIENVIEVFFRRGLMEQEARAAAVGGSVRFTCLLPTSGLLLLVPLV